MLFAYEYLLLYSCEHVLAIIFSESLEFILMNFALDLYMILQPLS